jgi:hypothetical protein
MSDELQPVAWRWRFDTEVEWSIENEPPVLTPFGQSCAILEPLYSAATIERLTRRTEALEAELAKVHLSGEAEAAMHALDRAEAAEAELAKAREAAQLLDTLCSWLLHRFGPDTPEGMEATFRQAKARAALPPKPEEPQP